jgi:hypothetical protein
MILCRENLKKLGEKFISELLQTPKSHIMLPAIQLRLHGNFGSYFELFSWCLLVSICFLRIYIGSKVDCV